MGDRTDKKTCHFCKRGVLSGVSCADCGVLAHRSCAERANAVSEGSLISSKCDCRMYHNGPYSATTPALSVAPVGPQPAVAADPLPAGAAALHPATVVVPQPAAVAIIAVDAGLQPGDNDDFLGAAGEDFFHANEPPVTPRVAAASDAPPPYDSLSYVSSVSNTCSPDVRDVGAHDLVGAGVSTAQAPTFEQLLHEFHGLSSLIQHNMAQTNESLSSIRRSLDSFDTRIANQTSAIDQLSSSVGNLAHRTETLERNYSQVTELVSRVDDLSAQVTRLSSSVSAKPSNLDLNSLAHEVQDRVSRATNVIFYGVPEIPPGTANTDIAEIAAIRHALNGMDGLFCLTLFLIGVYHMLQVWLVHVDS